MVLTDQLSLSLSTMDSQPQTAALKPLPFPDWSARLAGDDSLPAGVRESYRLTVSRFLAFCRQRGGGAPTGNRRRDVLSSG